MYDSWGSASERFADGTICLGIDLGTTNSCVGMWYVDRNHVKIFKNRLNRGRTTPSVVHFDPTSQSVDVGQAAIDLETSEPVGNTIRSIKRLMGQKYESKATDVARIYASYEVAPTAQKNVAVQLVRGHKKVQVQPEEVSAYILTELKTSAEAYFDGQTRLNNVVITVPAYFSDAQRKATITSALMAGFKAVRLLNEPTAAAMAYGLFLSGTKLVTVFDFGGGTLDVSLLRIQDGKFEVLGIGGDTNLGGEDINNLVLDHVLEVLNKRHNVIRSQVTGADLVRLKQEVEKLKIQLSVEESADVIVRDLAGVPRVTVTLTRRKFEQLCDPIWKKCLRIMSSVLKEAQVDAADMDEVILVGGSTRIPCLRSKISKAFHGKELCMSVNADEVVCEGAAIQAAILSGIDQRVFRDVLMMDVLPLPIGLETADGTMEVILPRNARIPTTVTKYFTTYEDNQRGITIEVYEGEKDIAKENDHICYFNFALPRNKIGKAGEYSHPVTFTMNASGILQVQAGIHHDLEESPMTKTAIFIMGAYIFALFAFYVFFRIYFVNERDITT
ncbi:glucose-regulated protein [Plasmopara halstedii]|uniref:Glucose-regulated protein n=1 Tax=Plasmopara halstedii TaxID=4781 RepID=A0A0P1AZK0_PLAHL|nr:glucose-regulated protein [Plasmopara halstedii]CEG46282.1 glucose-regulated protein [Plasmopara halstedii]|eukprot:XP_024582651.1 glucose-regulated protein [Plasmopara halstedii]